jgi:hypothetical protein
MVARNPSKRRRGRNSARTTEAPSSGPMVAPEMKQFLSARRTALADLAKQRVVDISSRVRSLPQADDAVMVMALATALGLDAREALNPGTTLDKLAANQPQRPPGIGYLEQLLFQSQRSAR